MLRLHVSSPIPTAARPSFEPARKAAPGRLGTSPAAVPPLLSLPQLRSSAPNCLTLDRQPLPEASITCPPPAAARDCLALPSQLLFCRRARRLRAARPLVPPGAAREGHVCPHIYSNPAGFAGLSIPTRPLRVSLEQAVRRTRYDYQRPPSHKHREQVALVRRGRVRCSHSAPATVGQPTAGLRTRRLRHRILASSWRAAASPVPACLARNRNVGAPRFAEFLSARPTAAHP